MSLSPERKQLLDELIESNTSLAQLQIEYGFNYKTIRAHYPNYRIGTARAIDVQNKLKDKEEIINRLAAERAPGGVIANAVGITSSTLSKHRPDLMWTNEEKATFAGSVSWMTRIIRKKTL